MEPTDLAALERRARLAYERARVVEALPWGLLAIPLGLLGMFHCHHSEVLLVSGAALGAALIALRVAGGHLGAAVAPGLLAGLVPFGLPLLVRVLGHSCHGTSCSAVCLPACLVGGLVAGAAIAVIARTEDRPLRFLIAAGLVSALTGAMGCAMAGMSGVLGMLAATAVVSVPAWALARAR